MKTCILILVALLAILFPSHIFALTEELLCSVIVHNYPLPNQKWKESENFVIDLPHLSKSVLYIQYRFTGASNVSLAVDLKDETDFVLQPNMIDGSTTPIDGVRLIQAREHFQGFYFGDAKNAHKEFVVNIYAISQ